jgi:hypothetical protein
VDVTFGEYLRALITADTELVHDDDLGYRVAVVEAFRRRGLYPANVRSLAPDSLVWQGSDEFLGRRDRLRLFGPRAAPLLKLLNDWNLSARRRDLFAYARKVRAALHRWFRGIRDDCCAGNRDDLGEMTGLALTDAAPRGLARGRDGLPKFEVHAVRPARRVGPDGQLALSLIVELTQRRPGFRDPDRQEQADRGETPAGVVADFTFRGGCTLVFDLETALPRYFIRKNVLSENRLSRQREYLTHPASVSLRETYFGVTGRHEPFALLHRDF